MATVKVDHRIYMPPVGGYEYIDDPGQERMEETAGGVSSAIEIAPDAGSLLPEGLQPPSTMTVIDQITRRGTDGKIVIDLVVEVDDVIGASEYETRKTII